MIPGLELPPDPLSPSPLDIQKTQHELVIIHHLSEGVERLKGGNLVNWGFEKPILDGSIQFTFLLSGLKGNHIRLIVSNHTTTTYSARVSFATCPERLPKEIQNIPGNMLRPINIPICEPGKESPIKLHKRKHVYWALSKGRFLYFVAFLQAESDIRKAKNVLLPRQPKMLPIEPLKARKRVLTRFSEFGLTFQDLIESSTLSSSSSMLSTSSSSIDPVALQQRRRSTLTPIDHLYTNIKLVPFKDIPVPPYVGAWEELMVEMTDTQGHEWEFHFEIKDGNIEVEVSSRNEETEGVHANVAISFYTCGRDITKVSDLHDGDTMICRRQMNVHSSKASILELGSLANLRGIATNVSITPYVYFVYGIHPPTSKAPSSNVNGSLILEQLGIMPLRIRLTILSYFLENDEYSKVVRNMRSLSMIDTSRVGITEFRSEARSSFQSPIPSPILPDASFDDDDDDDYYDSEDEQKEFGNQSEMEDEEELYEGVSSSRSIHAYKVWFGKNEDNLNGGTKG